MRLLPALAVPSQCDLCRQWGGSLVCADCVASFVARGPRCLRCAQRLGTAGTVCVACLRRPPPFERAVCAVDYAFPWDRLVTRFKFGQRPELAAALAALLHAAVARETAGDALPQALLPVPLARERLAERGFDQAWELAWRLGVSMRLPAWPRLLERPLDTPHQVALDRAARAANLRGAFVVADAAARSRLHGCHVALVDDVMTTGATLREAAAALRRAGAARVDVWAFARTP